MKINRTLLLVLIWFGIIEGLSTLFLAFAIIVKRNPFELVTRLGFETTPIGVQIAGPVHGFLFLGLVMLLVIGKYKIPLTTKTFIWGLIGSVLPFGPFIVDITLYKLLKK